MAEENTNQPVVESESKPVQITLDGVPSSLLQINEARNKPGVKIKEEAPGVYRTLQRLNG